MSAQRTQYEACWRELVERLGGVHLGARPTTTWATLSSIVATLNDVAHHAPGSVLVFPSGDHLPFTFASVHRTAGLLELCCERDVTVTRAVSLKLEVVVPDPDAALAYFRLDTAPLRSRHAPADFETFDPYTTYTRTAGETPARGPLASGRYAGAFLFVSACSPYLRNSDFLCAVHNSLRPARFREVLSRLAVRLSSPRTPA